jgi:hypothetical protein
MGYVTRQILFHLDLFQQMPGGIPLVVDKRAYGISGVPRPDLRMGYVKPLVSPRPPSHHRLLLTPGRDLPVF